MSRNDTACLTKCVHHSNSSIYSAGRKLDDGKAACSIAQNKTDIAKLVAG